MQAGVPPMRVLHELRRLLLTICSSGVCCWQQFDGGGAWQANAHSGLGLYGVRPLPASPISSCVAAWAAGGALPCWKAVKAPAFFTSRGIMARMGRRHQTSPRRAPTRLGLSLSGAAARLRQPRQASGRAVPMTARASATQRNSGAQPLKAACCQNSENEAPNPLCGKSLTVIVPTRLQLACF